MLYFFVNRLNEAGMKFKKKIINGTFIIPLVFLGLRCETRWLHLPYKPLSQRMLEEPFWLGLMTIAIVLIIIAFVWCAKRHFAEKFERFVSEELERGKLVEPAMLDWTRGRHLCHQLSLDTTTISRPVSPQTCLNVSFENPQ